MKVKQYHQKLENEEEFWGQLVEAVAAPIFVLTNGSVTYANAAAVAFCGRPYEALMHHRFRDFLTFADTNDADCLSKPDLIDCEAFFNLPSDQKIPVRLSFRRLNLPSLTSPVGKVAAYRRKSSLKGRVMVTISDLSAEKRAAELEITLQAKSVELENAAQSLDKVVSVQGESGELLAHNPQLEELLMNWGSAQKSDQLQAEIFQQKDLLQKIIDVNPAGLAVLTSTELVHQIANPAYRAITPHPEIDPVGLPIEQVWSGETGKIAREMIENFLASGKDSQSEKFSVTLNNGEEHTFYYRLHAIQWDGQQSVVGVVWDISELEEAHRQTEQLVVEATRRTDELTAVIDSLPEAVIIVDTEGNIVQVNPAVSKLVGFDITTFSKENNATRLRIRHLDGRLITNEEMPYAQALQGRPVRNQRIVISGPEEQDVHVMASASPIYANDVLEGAVVVWSDVSEIVQRRQELEVLVKVASALRNAIILDEMFPLVLNQVIDLLNVEGANLMIPDSATGDIVVRMGVGVWTHITGQRIPSGRGVTSQVIAEGQPYLNNDIQSDDRLLKTIFTGDLKCGACIPLRSHSLNIGALWVGRNTPISEEDVRLLTAIADIAASSIYRARLFEQTQLRFQRLSALHSIDMAITSSLDLQLTLSVLLDQVVSQMNVDAADILLFDPALHWLEFASGRGFLQPSARTEHQRLGDSPAGKVALERRVISLSDLSKEDILTEQWLSPEEGFESYFAAPLIAKGQVKGVLELFNRQPYHPDSEWLEFLETLATQAAIALDSAELFERLQRSNEELSMAYDATIEGWSRALELRDQETHGHAQRVTELTIRLARRLSVRDEEIPHYRRGVLLHDIGKMAIPDSILLKDSTLTPEEKEIMKRHPVYAYELLQPIAYLKPAIDIPYAHHEWWDGSGYPRGLKGEEIPMAARIFAVVDVWDALRSDRSYRMAWPVQKVIEHIRSLSGTHFDPKVVEEFIKMMQNGEPSSRFRTP